MGVKTDGLGEKDREVGKVTSLCLGVLCVSRAENPGRALLCELECINILDCIVEQSSF